MSIKRRSIIQLSFGVVVLLLLCNTALALAHGGEETVEEDEPISLSLETILLITVFVGLVLLIFISQQFGIDDTRFLVKIAAIALLLLLLDYTYIRFYR